MQMFLTRIGFGARAVVTGDPTQIDLPKHVKSGLTDAAEVLARCAASPSPISSPKTWWRHPLGGPASSMPTPRAARKPMADPDPELRLAVQFASAADELPARAQIRRWVAAALEQAAEIIVRIVDAEEAQSLNRDYRDKDYVPND